MIRTSRSSRSSRSNRSNRSSRSSRANRSNRSSRSSRASRSNRSSRPNISSSFSRKIRNKTRSQGSNSNITISPTILNRLLDKHVLTSRFKPSANAPTSALVPQTSPLYPQTFAHIDKIRDLGLPGSYSPPEAEITTNGNFKSVNNKGKRGVFARYVLATITAPVPSQPLTIKLGSDYIEQDIGSAKFIILQQINAEPEIYSILSPRIFSLCEESDILPNFGTAIIWGDLQDNLLESISMSSVDAIMSRLLVSGNEAQLFITNCLFVVKEMFYNLGASPRAPERIIHTDALKLLPAIVKGAYNLQRKGYATHPAFNKPPFNFKDAYSVAMNKPGKKEKEYLFVTAHGYIGNELPPEMKILAAKFLRVIEFSNIDQVVSFSYKSLYKYINDILRNNVERVMFENTTNGESKRIEVFKKLCKYYKLSYMQACQANTSLHLVDITHERIFEGHLNDANIVENHKITIQSLSTLYSIGIFEPVDYNQDPTPFLNQKEMFRRYRDIPFFSTTVKYNLIENMLQYAIENNKILNIFVFSCATRTNIGVIPPIPPTKQGKLNPNMKELTECKLFLARLNRLMTKLILIFHTNEYMRCFEYDTVIDRDTFRTTYIPPVNNMLGVLSDIETLYKNYFIQFKGSINMSELVELFSFAAKGRGAIGNELIDSKITEIDMEKIQIKIFLMTDFYNIFYTQVYFIQTLLTMFFNIVRAYISHINDECDSGECYEVYYSLDVFIERMPFYIEIKEFFDLLLGILTYIKGGLAGEFMKYERYNQVNAAYISGGYKLLYDGVAANMDYDRYGDVDFEFNEKKIGVTNPVAPGLFRRTSILPYKYNVLHNIDDIIKRRQTRKLGTNKRSSKRTSMHISV